MEEENKVTVTLEELLVSTRDDGCPIEAPDRKRRYHGRGVQEKAG
jgi:hypothetical protein